MMPVLPLQPAPFPNRLVDSAWLEHGPFAFWIVSTLQPRLTVELGTHNGYSFSCICQQLEKNAIPARAIAIDTWRGDEHAGAYSDKIYSNLATYVQARYPKIAELKRMYFSEALPSVADGSIDLLHVDGRHFYDDVVEDFTSWIPKLSDRAVVMFHDTQVRERDVGVHYYWAELEAQYPTFEFHHGHGLGVLGFGKNLPPAVSALFAQRHDETATAATRAAFATRGRRIAQWANLKTAFAEPKKIGKKLKKIFRSR